MNNENKPIALQFYKKAAALRISLMQSEVVENGFPKVGGYMLTFASASEEDGTKYKWDKASGSVSIYLAANETVTFIKLLNDPSVKIYHDPDKGKEGEGTRAKSIYSGESNSYKFLNIAEGEKKIGISLNKEEIDLIILMLKTSITRLYNW